MTIEEFEQAWAAFVRRWAGAGDDQALKLIDQVLRDGLEPVSEPVDAPSPLVALECEIAVVRRSSGVDEDAYRHAFADLKTATKDPVRQFCESGWRSVLNPRPEFDLWWYWVEHLDPTAEQVDPLLHHLLIGRQAGLATMPTAVPDRPVVGFEPGQSVRRACLFAGYDPDGVVDDYVVDYITELARHADVYYLADSTMPPTELAKLEGITKGAWSIRHAMYDFGSWSRLASDLVGWDRLSDYDEVMLVNDSAYLLKPLDELFERMAATPCDWWGLHPTRRSYSRDAGDHVPMPLAEAVERFSRVNDMSPVDHLHLSSYFLTFRAPVIADAGFRRRLDTVSRQQTKPRIILKYELGLSRYLLTAGYQMGAVIDALYPYLPIYTTDYWALLDRGFPLLKRNLLSDNPRQMPDLADWKAKITVGFRRLAWIVSSRTSYG